jgi:hypothetical protein
MVSKRFGLEFFFTEIPTLLFFPYLSNKHFLSNLLFFSFKTENYWEIDMTDSISIQVQEFLMLSAITVNYLVYIFYSEFPCQVYKVEMPGI